jgi:hypothetical protein
MTAELVVVIPILILALRGFFKEAMRTQKKRLVTEGM